MTISCFSNISVYQRIFFQINIIDVRTFEPCRKYKENLCMLRKFLGFLFVLKIYISDETQ